MLLTGYLMHAIASDNRIHWLSVPIGSDSIWPMNMFASFFYFFFPTLTAAGRE